MFVFAKTKPLAATSTARHSVDPRILALLILSTVLLACCGCGDSKAPVAPGTQAEPTPVAATAKPGSSKTDPLADVLRLAKDGDIDAAVEQFVASAPDNWVESTALEEFRMSEADFVALDRADKTRLRQRYGRQGPFEFGLDVKQFDGAAPQTQSGNRVPRPFSWAP
jgi:hypothetical protein